MKEEINYIAFPLPMIRKFFIEPNKAAADIIDYGIYRAAMGMSISAPEAPYRQLTYEFIRQGLKMPHGDSYRVPCSISQKLIKLREKDGYLDTLDYGGFSPESDFEQFDCEEDINLLMEIADSDEHFRKEVDEWYRLCQVQDVVGVSFSVSEHQQIKDTYQRIESGFHGEPQVPVSCKTSILLERQEEAGTEHQRARLCLYLGIRSLIGRSDIAVTTCEAIKSRMFGAKNKIELSDKALIDKILDRMKDVFSSEELSTIDGVKISFEKERKWVHLRRSNTEPIIRIYAEAPAQADAEALAQQVIGIAKGIIDKG